MGAVVVLVVLAALLLIVVGKVVKVIRPYERGVVERLGKYKGTVDPGLRIILPIDRMVRVDMRENVVDVPPQEVITSDNVVVQVDAVVFYEATDPQRLIYNVVNFIFAVTKLAQTNLRNVIGDMQLDEALTSRDTINGRLREILDDATDKWGIKVVRVEIQRIDPPPDVIASMHHQMKAERDRRASVTEAQGFREAAITRAEGEKQAAILSSEGKKQSQILAAEGDAEATRTRAEAEQFRQLTVAQGEADAIRSVYRAIHDGNPTSDVLAIKYLEALAKIADGQATKLIVPAEMTSILGALSGMAELLQAGGIKPDPADVNGDVKASTVTAAMAPRPVAAASAPTPPPTAAYPPPPPPTA